MNYVYLLPVVQVLPPPDSVLTHSGTQSQPNHPNIQSHRAGGNLTNADLIEQEVADAVPRLKAKSTPRGARISDQNSDVGDLISRIDVRIDVSDMSKSSRHLFDGPEVIRRALEGIHIPTAGVDAVMLVTLFAEPHQLTVVQPSDVGLSQVAL
jgi:hypothetical protein